VSYDGVKSIASPSLLYFHNMGCPLVTPETIESLKTWAPKLKYIATTKQKEFREDPRYADNDVSIEEGNLSLWMRADDLQATGHLPGVGIFSIVG
jgi:hypothetical protein